MNDRAYLGWMRAGFDAWALGVDASMVVGLRLAKFASGDDADGTEARLMVEEKMTAAAELHTGLLLGNFGSTPLTGTTKAIRHYKRKVAANRKRLSH